MRIWSLHPKYLDAKGIVALWRETLLAQKVLLGQTKGYTKHPQLNRFRQSFSPLHAISSYLDHVYKEATDRGYTFDQSKIHYQKQKQTEKKLLVTRGQVQYEMKHLLNKLKVRSPERFRTLIYGPNTDESDEDEENEDEEESKADQEKETKAIEQFIQGNIDPHPLFEVVEGNIETWEVVETSPKKISSKSKKTKTKNKQRVEEDMHQTLIIEPVTEVSENRRVTRQLSRKMAAANPTTPNHPTPSKRKGDHDSESSPLKKYKSKQ